QPVSRILSSGGRRAAGSHLGHCRKGPESDISRRGRGGVMKIASVAEVKARLSSYLTASATGPVVVTRNGKAVAVVVGVEDDEEVGRLLLAHPGNRRAILDGADRRIDQGAGIGHDEFWQRVESANRAREGNSRGKKRRTKRS